MYGVSWGPDGTLVAGGGPGRWGLSTFRDAPSAPEPLLTPDPDLGEGHYSWPVVLPGGAWALFTIVRTDRTIDDSQIAVVNVATGEKKVVHDEGFNPRYSPTGHLLYGLGGTIRAVPFDLESLEVTASSPTIMVEGVATAHDGSAPFALSRDGVLAYLPGPALWEGGRMVWVRRDGTVEPLPSDSSVAQQARISPDGSRWAAEFVTEGDMELWTVDLRGTRQRLTRRPGFDGSSLWTPEGDALVFSDGSGGLWRTAADGNGPVESGGIRMLREDNHRYRRLTANEEKNLLAAAVGDPLMTARVIVALDTGMRRGEMLLLQTKHVLWGDDVIRVVAANAKARKERRIPIATSRLRAVLEQRAFLGQDGYVLGNLIGERQTDFRNAWAKILAQAGITDPAKKLDGDLHWHDLRHECGSRLAERGVPLHEIRYLMGHASLTTTQRYLNATLESLKKSVKVLEQVG